MLRSKLKDIILRKHFYPAILFRVKSNGYVVDFISEGIKDYFPDEVDLDQKWVKNTLNQLIANKKLSFVSKNKIKESFEKALTSKTPVSLGKFNFPYNELGKRKYSVSSKTVEIINIPIQDEKGNWSYIIQKFIPLEKKISSSSISNRDERIKNIERNNTFWFKDSMTPGILLSLKGEIISINESFNSKIFQTGQGMQQKSFLELWPKKYELPLSNAILECVRSKKSYLSIELFNGRSEPRYLKLKMSKIELPLDDLKAIYIMIEDTTSNQYYDLQTTQKSILLESGHILSRLFDQQLSYDELLEKGLEVIMNLVHTDVSYLFLEPDSDHFIKSKFEFILKLNRSKDVLIDLDESFLLEEIEKANQQEIQRVILAHKTKEKQRFLHRILKSTDFQTLVYFPILRKNQMKGFVLFGFIKREDNWGLDTIAQIKMLLSMLYSNLLEFKHQETTG